MQLPETKISNWIDSKLNRLGQLSAWIWLLLMLIIVTNVVMRYFFGLGRIEFEEIQWHLYATGFLIGLSYAYVSDSHIRIDVVRSKLSDQSQVWIELYGILLLLLPFIILVLFSAWPFVEYSYSTGEVSEAPGGLGFRWLIKSVLGIGFILLLLAVLARLTRIWNFLFGWPNAIKRIE
ncbi:MAG: TRAP-type mannitol/chloroaromatic compound transport system permease small subunit [Candidatus Azotimanducaceae bacterium]